MTAVTEALNTLVTRIRAGNEWMQIALATGDEAGDWAPIEAFAAPEFRERGVQAMAEHYQEDGDIPANVLGTYLFRDLTYYPLLLAGCCFAAQRRVLHLTGAFEFRLDEIGPVRIRPQRFAVLPGDPLAGQPDVDIEPDEAALTERLHAEVQALCDPLLACFRASKYVAPANGWGSMLDSLLLGFTTAGRLDLGLDEAWSRWDAAISGRSFPVRRRPRRLPYEWAPGAEDEMSVRAGCCLWYVTDAAKANEHYSYCRTCYLETDERRIQRTVEWKQKVAAEQAASGE